MKLGFLIIPAVLLSSTHAFAADPDYDFSTTDCNSPKVREMLMESYNELPHDNDETFTVIDVYDQKTISGGKNKLVCYGTYEFSDGDKSKLKYTLYKNSFGAFINGFD